MTDIYLTGYTGFLGRYVLQSSASHNIRIFPLEADFKSALIYPDLINISSGSIIHCGATSNRNSVDKDLFKKNVTATSQIASLIRDRPDVNLIFTSANSLGSDSDSSCIRSLYCFQNSLLNTRFNMFRSPFLSSDCLVYTLQVLSAWAYWINYSIQNHQYFLKVGKHYLAMLR